MGYESLEDVLQSTNDIVGYFRGLDHDATVYTPNETNRFPDEYTNWIEEQRAIHETCSLVDQSHHMMSLHIAGPGALALFSDVGVNSFQDFKTDEPPQAKQLVQVTPGGNLIRDTILFYLGENEYVSVGSPVGNDWLAYCLESGDYDASIDRPIYSPVGEYEPIGDVSVEPPDFRFEIQGPNALPVLRSVTDGDFPNISFFEVEEISIAGQPVYVLGHGMAEAPGLEIFGPYSYHDDVWERILAAGREYGIRRMGSKTYKTNKISSGWIKLPVPGIYTSEELREYREWLGADSIEANLSIGGSFPATDIEAYYMTPEELGYGRHIDFDHEFVGKQALQQRVNASGRTKVTYVWNDQDVIDVYASLFRSGETKKYINLPDTANRWSKTHYDVVTKGDKVVGLSKYPGYRYPDRSMLSLGVIDEEYSTPGTEVSFVWGEADSPKSKVERHAETEIRARVAQVPYADRGRQAL